MKLEALPNNMVFTKGSDFWITADKPNSSWTLKLDWYVNFLIAKTSTAKKHDLHPELINILKEEEMTVPTIKAKEGAPLWIASNPFLPSKALLILPFSKEETESWLEELKKLWQNLNQPSLRVFLPKGLSEKDFTHFCEKNIDANISYVTEETYFN